MSRESVEMAICNKVYSAEKLTARALGHDRMEICMLSFGAFCGVYVLALEDERPTVLTRFRPLVVK